ncbi:hypothetical protein PspLS_00551, partial [Pyricularia sp. CBS 133598]
MGMNMDRDKGQGTGTWYGRQSWEGPFLVNKGRPQIDMGWGSLKGSFIVANAKIPRDPDPTMLMPPGTEPIAVQPGCAALHLHEPKRGGGASPDGSEYLCYGSKVGAQSFSETKKGHVKYQSESPTSEPCVRQYEVRGENGLSTGLSIQCNICLSRACCCCSHTASLFNWFIL